MKKLGWWKKVMLGMTIAMRVQALLIAWRQAGIKDRFRDVVYNDPVLAPFGREIESLIDDAERVL